MKRLVGMTALSLMLAGAPAWAMDCSKATSALDKGICSDRQLKAADEAMSAAYFKLLESITDPEIHASLIDSQRRWIKAREKNLGSMADGSQDQPDREQQRAILLDTMRQRTRFLSAHSGGQPDFVAKALKQRQIAHAYSGGPYAGFDDTTCSFIPKQNDNGHWLYSCFGSRAYQNGNRICSENNDFATYTISTTQDVSVIENGQWKPVATRSYGTGKWVRSSEPPSSPSGHENSHKIDPEAVFDEDDDKGWMHACLTDPSFPFNSKYDDM
jgi:uncharacterized protein YecT (DUF1311 family)